MTEMTGIHGMDHDFRHARHIPIPSGSSPRGHSGIVDSAGVIAHNPELFLSTRALSGCCHGGALGLEREKEKKRDEEEGRQRTIAPANPQVRKSPNLPNQ